MARPVGGGTGIDTALTLTATQTAHVQAFTRCGAKAEESRPHQRVHITPTILYLQRRKNKK